MHMIRRFTAPTAARTDLPAPVNLSRRDVLQGFGGLALGVYFAPVAAAQDVAIPGHAGGGAPAITMFEPNAFVRIGTDGTVTVLAKHLEMGQGTYTGLATLTPREEKVLRMRFGIGEKSDHTLEEVGRDFCVTRERIRQIEAKALRKLRHPSRSRQLRSFLER